MQETNLLPRGKMSIVIGGQAGSESKGKLSAYLVSRFGPDLIVMTASPNAGHTAISPVGHKYVTYNLPVGAVASECPILLGPASIINLQTLTQECTANRIDQARVIIHPRASIVCSWHLTREKEDGLSNLGSTLQGVGACRSDKMNRRDNVVLAATAASEYGFAVADTTQILHQALAEGKRVLCESTQGFDLDLEHGIDPHYCTSKMVNTSMIAAEAGVPPQFIGNVFGVIRPYPIRVNNRTGTSGPYAEAEEITWKDVADRCRFPGNHEDFGEITTTTKLPRRVFEFSWERFMAFILVCRPTHLCLQFANYIDWSCFESTGFLSDQVMSFIRKLEAMGLVPVTFVGTGPANQHMVELVDSDRSFGH